MKVPYQADKISTRKGSPEPVIPCEGMRELNECVQTLKLRERTRLTEGFAGAYGRMAHTPLREGYDRIVNVHRACAQCLPVLNVIFTNRNFRRSVLCTSRRKLLYHPQEMLG